MNLSVSNRPVAALAWVALAVAVAYLSWRGIVRGMGASFDLTVGFAAGQAWLAGQNPYDVSTLKIALAAGGGPQIAADQLAVLRNVYFPTTLPLFALFGPIPWTAAKVLMVALNTAASGVVALGLCRLLGWRPSHPFALGMIALVLALAPFHTSIAIGQPAILAASLIVSAVLLDRAGRPVAAGIAFGLATAAKIQLGLPFLAFQILRRRWSTAVSGGLVVAALTIVAVVRMQVAGVPWASGWQANLAALAAPGGTNDASTLNPERHSLVNLQYLLGSFGIPPGLADALTFTLVGLAAVVVVVLSRRIPRAQELVVLAQIGVLSLLVVYHRYYDAVILALPIAWAFAAWRAGERRRAALVLLLCADFLVPVQTALNNVANRQILPAEFTNSILWRSVLTTQHVWALILIAGVLLWSMVKADRKGPEEGSRSVAEGTTG